MITFQQHLSIESLEEGDFVRDPMDGEVREVTLISRDTPTTGTVQLRDGGYMSLEDCWDVFLPSEVEHLFC